MKAVLFVAVLLCVVTVAFAVDKPHRHRHGRHHRQHNTNATASVKKVHPRIAHPFDGHYYSKEHVITYPKGQIPAEVLAASASGTQWLSPVVTLTPEAEAQASAPPTLHLQASKGAVCTPVATNVRSAPSTSGKILFTTTAGEKLTVTATKETAANGYTWIPVSGRSKNGYVAKSLTHACSAPAPSTPASSKYPLFKQCGQSWSSQQLGSCSGTTVCKAGCAVSSVAMILKSRGVNTDPGVLNTWLKKNGGFAGCGIYWAKVDAFGKTKCQGFQRGVSYATLCSQVKSGYGVVLNVNNGGHYVLATGCDGKNNLYVNDPGFSRTSYPYSAVGTSIVYH